MKHIEVTPGIGADGKVHRFDLRRGFSLCGDQRGYSVTTDSAIVLRPLCARCIGLDTNPPPPVSR